MRSKFFLWLVATLIGAAFAFPPMISAAEKKAEKAAAPAKEMKEEKPKTMSATGEVASVDAKAGMLSVKVKDKAMSFTAETKAAKEALGKVMAGDRVTVSYTEKDGKMMASSVKAAKKKAEKKEAKKDK